MLARMTTTLYQNGAAKQQQQEQPFCPDLENQERFLLNLYPQARYQELRAFGGAITESVGITLGKVPPALADEVIDCYFGPEGLGYRIIRTHLDSCDFSQGNYSAVENSGDAGLSGFSLRRDEENILPYIKKASRAAGSSLPVMLTPWSPPAYMKTNGAKNGGGKLRPDCYGAWAEYICNYVLKYRRLGADIRLLSVQNEPNATQKWDSCIYSAAEEKDFLQNHLSPALMRAGLEDLELYIWDHNKERLYERAAEVLDETAAPLVTGLAFHWYSGDHFDAVRMVREQFPNQQLLFSESCIEYSRFDKNAQLQNAQMYAHDIIGNLNAGMNTFIDWNIVLDETGGPNHAGNYCEAPILCDTRSGTLTKKLSYYYIAHFSRHIKPGAVRIATTQYTSELEVTAFQNPDGGLAAVIFNPGAEALPVILRLNGHLAPFTAEKESISTVLIGP